MELRAGTTTVWVAESTEPPWSVRKRTVAIASVACRFWIWIPELKRSILRKRIGADMLATPSPSPP